MPEKEKESNAGESVKEATEANGPNGSGSSSASEGTSQRATATAKPKDKKSPKRKPPGILPPWKVLLHNDDVNEIPHVVKSIVELTPLNEKDAQSRVQEAEQSGLALLLTTHKERAELYQEQLQSKGLVVTIELAE